MRIVISDAYIRDMPTPFFYLGHDFLLGYFRNLDRHIHRLQAFGDRIDLYQTGINKLVKLAESRDETHSAWHGEVSINLELPRVQCNLPCRTRL